MSWRRNLVYWFQVHGREAHALAEEKVEEEETSFKILKYIHVIVCFIGLQSPLVTVARDPVL